ncbi:MAG: P-loop NTPase fold protein [Sedimentisphaeraceae bacterium JB056]
MDSLKSQSNGKLIALDPLINDSLADFFYDGENGSITKIVNLIENNIEPPYSIALNGGWGTGKTTALKAIENKLAVDEYPVIWFNPWEYDNSGDVVMALQKRIATSCQTKFKIAIKEMGVLGLSLLTSGVSTLGKKVAGIDYKGVKDITEDVRSALRKGQYETYDDVVEATKNDFIKLTHLIFDKNKGKPLIIILDDLDRCLPENALKLLEALKNQFVAKNEKTGKAANVIIISGIDTGVAKQFIVERYKGLGSNFAINYFRKIFNLTLELPAKQEDKLSRYLQEYVNELFAGVIKKENTSDICKLIIKMANISGNKSIRAILNIVNNYYVFCHTNQSNHQYIDVLPFLFLREMWNDFYEELSLEVRRAIEDNKDGHLTMGMVLADRSQFRFLDSSIRLNSLVDIFNSEIRVSDILAANLL